MELWSKFSTNKANPPGREDTYASVAVSGDQTGE